MPPCEGGYKEFKIGELFKAQTGDVDLQQKDINGLGTYFINSGVQNFGIKGKTDRKAKVFPANTITIDFFGNSYYRSYEYKLATHNHVFSLSGDVIKNELVGLYLTSCMSYMRNIFSFNNMGTWSVIKNLNVILPVTKSGEIDFQYIEERMRELEEERMRELEEERMRELEAYLAAAGFANCDLTPEEQVALRKFSNGEVKFTSCRINGLFEIKKGTRLTKADMLEGATNFIGATASNNGITSHISNTGHIHPSGLITVSYNGSVGEAFYQIKDFWASDDINVLYPKFSMSESLALYFLCPLRKKGKAYGYAYKWRKEIMEDDTIYLPVNQDGEIDYDFMETYISAIKKQIIARLKAEIAREHKAYESVIND